MNSGIVIGRFDFRTWNMIFIFFILLLLSLILCCLCNPKWIYSDLKVKVLLDDRNIDLSELECGLLYCFNPKFISYTEISKKIKLEKNSESENKTKKSLKNVKPLKEMLTRLNRSGKIAVIFFSLCLFTLVLWFSALILLLKNFNVYCYSWTSGVSSCAFFLAGSLCWFVLSPSSFKSCSSLSEKDSSVNTCSSTGPVLSIIISVLFPVIITLFLVTSIIAFRKKKFCISPEPHRQITVSIPTLENNCEYRNPESPVRCESPEIQIKSFYRGRGNFSLYEPCYNEVYNDSQYHHKYKESGGDSKDSIFDKNNKDHLNDELENIPEFQIISNQNIIKFNYSEDNQESNFKSSSIINSQFITESDCIQFYSCDKAGQNEDEVIIFDYDEILEDNEKSKDRFDN